MTQIPTQKKCTNNPFLCVTVFILFEGNWKNPFYWECRRPWVTNILSSQRLFVLKKISGIYNYSVFKLFLDYTSSILSFIPSRFLIVYLIEKNKFVFKNKFKRFTTLMGIVLNNGNKKNRWLHILRKFYPPFNHI